MLFQGIIDAEWGDGYFLLVIAGDCCDAVAGYSE